MRYKVGGCVRDNLIGITPKDIDWIETELNENSLLNLGYRKVGRDFSVYLNPDTRDEVALPRRHDGLPSGLSTLDADLFSRDLTINAMAMTREGEIHDPTGGQRDIKNKILRHCHDQTFQDDPIRALRAARFLARYGEDWSLAEETEQIIRRMAEEGRLDQLTPERVWREIKGALKEEAPWLFFETLQKLDVLKCILPEVALLEGVPQRADHHPEVDTFIHVMMVVRRACELSRDPVVRWAALLHDTGKGRTPQEILPAHHGHEETGALMNEALCKRLKVPREYSQLAITVARYHTKVHTIFSLNNKSLLKLLKNLGQGRDYTVIHHMATCCMADAQGRKGKERLPYYQEKFLRMASDAVRKTRLSDLDVNMPIDRYKIPELIYRHELKKLSRFRQDVAKNPYLMWGNSQWSAPVARQLHQLPEK